MLTLILAACAPERVDPAWYAVEVPCVGSVAQMEFDSDDPPIAMMARVSGPASTMWTGVGYLLEEGVVGFSCPEGAGDVVVLYAMIAED